MDSHDEDFGDVFLDAVCLYVIAAFLFLGAVVALGAEPIFYWKSCAIIDGQLSACEHGGQGSETEMLKAEKLSRKRHHLFLREYAESDPALAWPGARVWVRGGKEVGK